MKKQDLLSELSDTQLDSLNRDLPFDGAALDAVRQKVRAQTGAAVASRRHLGRRIGVLLAAAALLVAASVAVGATYRKWSLPEPQTYTGSLYSEQGEATYPLSAVSSLPPEDVLPQSDEAFIASACELFEAVGVPVTDVETVTVVRRVHQGYNRNEAVVSYGNSIDATFNADTGELVSACRYIFGSEEQLFYDETAAAARAAQYYAALPVPQGYELCANERFDTDIWTFHFQRRTPLGILSAYEAVKVTINPEDGSFISCHVFSTKLLDDHAAGDEPLSEDEARRIGAEYLDQIASNGSYVLEKIELSVVSPNYFWNFALEDAPASTAASTDTALMTTPDPDAFVSLQYADVTRYAYTLTYNNPDSFFADKVKFYIDLYTGELLGGDMIG